VLKKDETTRLFLESNSGKKHLRCAPANSPSKAVIGELENRQTARFLRPLALGAWTYVAGSPTAKAYGVFVRHSAHVGLKGFPHPRTVRTRPTSMISEEGRKATKMGRELGRPASIAVEKTHLSIGDGRFFDQSCLHVFGA
jgi:hypothetical protein